MAFGFFDPWPGDTWDDRLRRELSEVFGRLGGTARAGTPYPPVNLYEKAEGYVLTAEVPGLEPKDFDVSVEGDRVTLRGERRIEHPSDAHTGVHRRERPTGVFRRVVQLPRPADADRAQAVYRNGVLVLMIPKAKEHQPRQINVQTG